MRSVKEIPKKQKTEFILPNHLKELRAGRYLSQAEVAERIGVCKSTVSMWENHSKGIKDSHKLALCDVLGCSITELFDWRN